LVFTYAFWLLRPQESGSSLVFIGFYFLTRRNRICECQSCCRLQSWRQYRGFFGCKAEHKIGFFCLTHIVMFFVNGSVPFGARVHAYVYIRRLSKVPRGAKSQPTRNLQNIAQEQYIGQVRVPRGRTPVFRRIAECLKSWNTALLHVTDWALSIGGMRWPCLRLVERRTAKVDGSSKRRAASVHGTGERRNRIVLLPRQILLAPVWAIHQQGSARVWRWRRQPVRVCLGRPAEFS